MVFQDPYGSLDPRMTVEHIVCEPLTAQPLPAARSARRDLAGATLEQVGLRSQDLDKYPMSSPVASASASPSHVR